jgi:hypothetical protein
VPQRLEFNEPSEGLVFGKEVEGIDLRYIPGAAQETAANVGQLLDPKATLAPEKFPRRQSPGFANTLQVGGPGGLAALLLGLFPHPQPTSFGPAAFAVQMVRVPEQMLFLPVPNGENR